MRSFSFNVKRVRFASTKVSSSAGSLRLRQEERILCRAKASLEGNTIPNIPISTTSKEHSSGASFQRRTRAAHREAVSEAVALQHQSRHFDYERKYSSRLSSSSQTSLSR